MAAIRPTPVGLSKPSATGKELKKFQLLCNQGPFRSQSSHLEGFRITPPRSRVNNAATNSTVTSPPIMSQLRLMILPTRSAEFVPHPVNHKTKGTER